jgi:hypothetical protein
MRTIRINENFLLWGAAALGAVLLAAAIPCFSARLLETPGDDAREAMLEGWVVPPDRIQNFIETRHVAASFRPSRDIYADRALGAYEEAKKAGLRTANGRKKLVECARWQLLALDLSPADTYGWARLAFVYWNLEGNASTAAAMALANSIVAAPYEPRLAVSRLTMAMVFQAKLSTSVRAQIPQMMRAAWKIDPRGTSKAAKEGGWEIPLRGIVGG